MEEDKPFACTLPGCKMAFTNEDHLEVHKKKHEFSLSFSPSEFKSPLVDQTPTPTRFLDSSIFQDFHSDNPFDATFRKANTQRIDTVIPEPPNLNSNLPDPEPLSTPSITLNNENDLLLYPLWKESNSITSLKPLKPMQKRQESINEESSDTLPFELGIPPHSNSSTGEETEDLNKGSAKRKSTRSAKPLADGEPNSATGLNTAVVQTPVITSIGNHSKATATCVPTAVVVTRPSTSDVPSLSSSVSQMSVTTKPVSDSEVSQQTVIHPVTVSPVVQLIIRLPDGRAIPVLIPNGSIGADAASTAAPAHVDKTVSNISPKSNSTSSLAKMKLKQVLSSNKAEQKNGRSMLLVDPRSRTNTSNVLSSSSSSPPSLSSSSSQHATDYGLSESPPTSPRNIHRSAGRKRREMDDDPEEKRRKSLERNRAAATRCRQKRKQWIQTLGKKADELAATNVQLQNEVNMLRNEVAQLKTMLLAHKDCPVTQQQKAIGCTEILIPTTVPINLNAHIAPVAFQERAQDLSSLQMIELMDTETSSSQSGNVSDTSEVSMRDR